MPRKSTGLAPKQPKKIGRVAAAELRQGLIQTLYERNYDPVAKLIDMTNDETVDPEVKARIHIEMMKHLIPAAPKISEGQREGDIKVMVQSFQTVEAKPGDQARPVKNVDSAEG
jgi:hypothetical protein